MASSIAKPQKRLVDFLNEQQEPFMLELYLLEKGYSKRWCFNEDSSNNLDKTSSCSLNKKRKRKILSPFCKILISLVNKLVLHSQSSTLPTRDYELREKHAICNVEYSSATYSPMFNSCSNVDEEGNSISSHRVRTKECHIRWKRQRCIEGRPKSLEKIPLHRVPNLNEEVGRMQQRIRKPKKITEESLLSVAILNLLGVSIKKENCTNDLQEYLPEPHVLKSKRVSHKIKKLLFDCVRDITIPLPTKEDRKQVCRESMGPIELGKLTCQRTQEWGQHIEDGLTSLLTNNYLDSIIEWSNFESHVKDISFEITDAILEIMNNEIVSEMIGTLATP
ncbi:uncharacterized protein [Cicer arietinum]|uniref:Uncharacterized protein LOC101497748 isoform X2 n=1 Tax=Cicer arietinum TaxID=3827 RepID=A0A1S2Y404_CICAR|nr:uncharacterized protein LOC101497748 isoform X2 [Cicer arietinum]